jgi:hypothetical protein
MGNVQLVIDVITPLGFQAICSADYWERITTIKHPPMRGQQNEVAKTLSDPDEIRQSVADPDVLLFHRRVSRRWICAVVRRQESMGYLITAYPADKVKRGELVWKK